MENVKQLLILNRNLTIKKILSINKVIPVQDIISPQKTTFEIIKSKDIVIGDLIVLKRENLVEYIGIIQDVETDKTTKLASYPLISITDIDCVMGNLNGNVFNWIKDVFEYNLVNTLTDSNTSDYVDNLLALPFEFKDNTSAKTLKLEVNNGNFFDVLIDIFKKTGIYLSFNLQYVQGKVSNILVNVNIADENTKILLRHDNPLIFEEPVIENSQNQNVNKIIFVPNDDNTTADAKNIYVFYLLDNNTVTTNPNGTDTGKRLNGVKQTIQEYSDDDYTKGLQVIAEETMLGNTLDHQITIKILQNSGFDVQLYDRVSYIDTQKTYDTYVTRIENYNDKYKTIKLGVLRTTLTDKIKNLEKLFAKKQFSVASGGSSSGGSGSSYDDTEIRQSIANLETNKADKTEIPDVSNFITKAVNDLVNYYTKSQTYTQAEVNALVSAIPKFSVEVVTSLPTKNISTTTVYLVASGSETQNLYVEYIYINDTWEKLGEQRIDLSNYYTKVQTEELVESAKLSFKKVASLPSSAEVEDNTIYLLQHTENGSVYYTEHIYKDGQWEQFGSNADVDIVGILDNTKKIASSTGGFSAGSSSNVTGTGGAIGKSSQATRGGAIGENATTSLGFAGGYNAKTIKTLADGISTSPSDAIQLGTGTNQKEKSMQVYDDNIYDANTHTLTVKKIELDGEPLSNSSSFMPIGSIFASAIPQEDARVHLLDGSTIPQTGVYADFANLIKSLVATGNNIAYETNDEFNADVSTYGQCGKFVIDDTAGTIRLPIITEFVAGLTDLTNIGMAQLDMFKSHYHNIKTEGGNPPNGVVNPCAGVFGGNQVTSNPNPIESTGGSETRPKNIRYPYYIVLASGYKSSSQVNIDNVMNEVNKLNQDYIVENTVTSTGGFRKWASGLKEYWGQTTTTSADHNITFPEAFSGNNYGIAVVALTDNTASDIISAKVQRGTSNMTVRMRYRSTSGQGNATVNIAYWVKGY